MVKYHSFNYRYICFTLHFTVHCTCISCPKVAPPLKYQLINMLWGEAEVVGRIQHFTVHLAEVVGRTQLLNVHLPQNTFCGGAYTTVFYLTFDYMYINLTLHFTYFSIYFTVAQSILNLPALHCTKLELHFALSQVTDGILCTRCTPKTCFTKLND